MLHHEIQETNMTMPEPQVNGGINPRTINGMVAPQHTAPYVIAIARSNGNVEVKKANWDTNPISDYEANNAINELATQRATNPGIKTVVINRN